MREGKEDMTDHVRLSDIAYAASWVLRECLTPGGRGGGKEITEGWMLVGKWGGLNVTVVRREMEEVREALMRGGGGVRVGGVEVV